MPDLLLELGCEELPASFVEKAYNDLAAAVAKRLTEASIPFEPGNPPIGTPRRLIVHFRNLVESQPDQTKEMRGPSVQASYDPNGQPTKALEGFCRGQGVDPSSAERRGEYVWVTKHVAGRPTREILAEALPEAIRSLSFEKSMRWGRARMRFARPIRWILASFGGERVSFEVEGVHSDLYSRGHRFNHPDRFEARTYDELVDGLISRDVEPDPAERRKRIQEGSVIIATGEPQVDEALLDENVYLTEWPTPIEGQFKEDYLGLPEPVLVTAMAKHEKMFPVRGRDGKLLNRFIFIRNSGEDATVRAGAEWVLNARFNDAKFFFDEDRKHSLTDFLEKTSGILFQEKLGTVRKRAARLSELAAAIAEQTGADEGERELAKQAGLYCKADLASGLVSELASLQGVIGGEYARREGFPEAVCKAIASHYDWAKTPRSDSPSARTTLRVILADQVDKLAGYLGVGLVPSGSSDPFGLRRAAGALVEVAWLWPESRLRYDGEILDAAIRAYAKDGIELDREAVASRLIEVLESRYESLLPNERADLVQATLRWVASLQEARLRLNILKLLADDKDFVQTATRPINILNAALQKGQYEPGRAPLSWLEELSSPDGLALHEAALSAEKLIDDAYRTLDPVKAADSLRGLADPINRFFESTMVMDENAVVRHARLELVHVVSSVLLKGGDFSKVVIEG